MSSGAQTCPFCGKSFKRLQSHLPHCKMLPVSQGTVYTKTTPFRQDVMTNKKQKMSLSSPASQSRTSVVQEINTDRTVKSLQTFSSTSPPESIEMGKASPLQPPPSSSSSSSLTLSKSSLTNTKSKKLKLVDQIKMAALSSSRSSPLQPATIYKPNKKSLRALIEANRLSPVLASGEVTKSTQQEPSLVFPPITKVKNSVTLGAPGPTGGNSNRPTLSDLDQTDILSADHRPAEALKKRSQRAKTGTNEQTTKANYFSWDLLTGTLGREPVGGDDGVRPNGRVHFWEDLALQGSSDDLSGKDNNTRGLAERDRFKTLGSVKSFSLEQNHQTNLQSNTDSSGPTCKAAVPGEIETAVASSGSLPGITPFREPVTITSSVLCHNRQQAKLLDAGPLEFRGSLVLAKEQILNRKGSSKETDNSKEIPSFLNQDGGSPLVKPTSSLSSNVSPPSSLDAESFRAMNSMKRFTATNRVGHSSATDQTQGSVPLHVVRSFPPLCMPMGAADARPKLELGSSKQPATHQIIQGALAERSLGQVTLRELPDWLALKTPGSPSEGFDILQRGWLWYYRRYIDVRRAGVGGVAMLLTGYCILSYIWSFPHIKRDRWRRYH